MHTSAMPESVTAESGWFGSLGSQGRRAFAGAFGGFALDSYDF
jgi:hypothetical protein